MLSAGRLERQSKNMKLIGALCLLAAVCASASIVKNAASTSRIESEYLVSVRPHIMRGQTLKQTMAVFENKMAALSKDISVVSRYDFNGLSIVHIHSNSEVLAASLYSFPEVTSVEANLLEYALDQECTVQVTTSGIWGLARISKRQDSNDTTYSYQEGDGAGAYVYVVDSGILLSHNDFGGRAIHGFTADGINEPPEIDYNGHGTHCAGTVMGNTYGVAKYAGAIAVKVLNGFGLGSTNRAISGLEWVLEDFNERNNAAGGNLAAVISMSLRFTPSDAMDAALQELFDAGCITVASAGNQASVSCSQSPARAAASVSVMASDVNNELASFSNYGDCADVIAPGVDVLSCCNTGDDSACVKTGTSMSCPHTAGVLLRYMSQMIQKTGYKPSPAELKDWIRDSATRDVINLMGRPDTNNAFVYAPCDITSEDN